jgi:hypothetical protein
MCHWWFSVGGLVLDIVGFLTIAREWHWAIGLQGAEQVERRGNVKDDDEDRKYRWLGWLDQYKLRTGLFRFGVALVLLGFFGQAIGSLPTSLIARIGIKSCS